MEEAELNIVTGASGYTGRYITRLLLAQGKRVISLTGHPDYPNPFGAQVLLAPFNFDQPAELARSIEGATTLFNTFWIRFAHGETTFDRAVENTKALIRAAEESGVRRIVHISITNASAASPLPYFKGKGLVEEAISQSTLSHAILRPALIFGAEDVLINNIAWLLRQFPFFVIPGSGEYRLQPVFVEDLARLAVSAASTDDNQVLDATGPETYTFDGLVRLIRKNVNSRARVVHAPPRLALFLSWLVGNLVGDVVLTQDEVRGLCGNLLTTKSAPTGDTRLSDWMSQNADKLGAKYASELKRHYRR